MPTPHEQIEQWRLSQVATEEAARRLVANYRTAFNTLAQMVENVISTVEPFGLNAVLARMTPEAAAAFQTVITNLRLIWVGDAEKGVTGISPYPMPTIPLLPPDDNSGS